MNHTGVCGTGCRRQASTNADDAGGVRPPCTEEEVTVGDARTAGVRTRVPGREDPGRRHARGLAESVCGACDGPVMATGTLRFCTTCAGVRGFECPPCADDHGDDCPELTCVACGTAVFGGHVLEPVPVLGRTGAAA